MSDGKMTHERAVFLGGLSHWTAGQAKEVKFEMVRARGVEDDLTEQLRQKDETIRALTETLEQMTYFAVWLHDQYRKSSNIPSDGTHEAAFNRALALVEKARKP